MTLSASSTSKVFLMFLLCIAGFLKAQNGANIYSGDTLKSAQKKLILVPFDPILYNSEIDREIAKKHNLTFEQIRDKFRVDLDLHMGMFLKTRFEVVAPLREKDESVKRDLDVIYKGIAFNYVALKAENAPKTKSNRTEIKNGQIIEIDNSGPKYMSTVVKDAKLLPYLNGKYGSELYVFITQFEIRNDLSDQLALARGEYSRFVLVHYSILDNDSKQLQGGVSRVQIPLNEYDPKKIAGLAFRAVAEEITGAIPVAKQ